MSKYYNKIPTAEAVQPLPEISQLDQETILHTKLMQAALAEMLTKVHRMGYSPHHLRNIRLNRFIARDTGLNYTAAAKLTITVVGNHNETSVNPTE